MPENLENSAVATGLEKVSFHSNPNERQRISKNAHYRTIALISHAGKVMLKILQARLQQYVKAELPPCLLCILPPCLFTLYAEYIMRNAGLGRSTSWNQDCREKYQ